MPDLRKERPRTKIVGLLSDEGEKGVYVALYILRLPGEGELPMPISDRA